MMKARVLKFSQDWDKLKDRVFATVRVHRGDLKFVPDETVQVESPKTKFTAKVLIATSMKLGSVPLAFLEYDLEVKPGEKRQDLINKLGKLYKFSQKPKETDEVTIYILQMI